jgi:cytochrome d ubiquinol oxidase subunit I
VPNVFIQYWSMRVMAYLATVVLLFALWGGWLLYRHRLEHAKWFLRLAPWAVILPVLMNTAGWLLTENGRQPWIVQGLMKTANGVSPSVSATDIWISLIAFILVFVALGIADCWLMIRYGRRPLGEDPLAKVTAPEGAGATAEPGSSEENQSELVY